MKKGLTNTPVLGYPDPQQPRVLDTDARDVGAEAMLAQIQDGEEGLFAYFSKTVTPPDKHYSATRKELLAVVKAVKHFRPYL